MEFEFDPQKSKDNKDKHGMDFLEAQALFLSSPVLIPVKGDFGEQRSLAIGMIGNKHWSAIITKRGDKIRIISVRRARDNERALYDKA